MYYFKSDFKKADQMSVDIFNHPKLKEAQAIKDLCDALDDNLKKYFLYASIKNNILMLWFNHQIGVIEFNAKKNSIMSKMRQIYKDKKLKGKIFFREVDAKVKLQASIQTNETKTEPDIATGDFEIKCKDKKLKKMFENIQRAIKRNNQKAQNV